MSTEPHYTDALAIADQQLSNALRGAMWDAVEYQGEDFTESEAFSNCRYIHQSLMHVRIILESSGPEMYKVEEAIRWARVQLRDVDYADDSIYDELVGVI